MGENSILWALVVSAAVGTGALVLYANETQEERRAWCGVATVVAVGGCDRFGTCGTVLSNGKTSAQRYPVVGGACQ